MNILNTTKWIFGMIALNLLIMPSAMAFNASVSSKYSYDNNILKTKDNKSGSNMMTVSPKIAGQLLYKGYAFVGDYALNYVRHVEKPKEDSLTQNLSFKASSDSKAKYSGTLGYVYSSSFDVRGEAGSEALEVPDLWVNNTFSSSFLYRTDDRRVDVNVSLDSKGKRYSVEKSKIKDSDILSINLTHNYRLTGKSTANYSIKAGSSKYIADNATGYDSFDMSYLVGFDWKYSGKVDATANIGWGTRRLVEGGGQRFSDVIVRVNIDWALKSYSRYQLTIDRSLKASPAIGAVNSVSNKFKLSWAHTFTRKVATNLGFSTVFTRSETGQNDALGTLSTAVRYKATKGVVVSPSLEWKTFKSTESGQEYGSYLASLMFTWSYSR